MINQHNVAIMESSVPGKKWRCNEKKEEIGVPAVRIVCGRRLTHLFDEADWPAGSVLEHVASPQPPTAEANETPT